MKGKTPSEHLDSSCDEDQQRRAIVLQSMLLDVLLSLLTTACSKFKSLMLIVMRIVYVLSPGCNF